MFLSFLKRKRNKTKEPLLEESLDEALGERIELAELPLDSRPFFYVGLVVLFLGLAVGARIIFWGLIKNDFYQRKAVANLVEERVTAGPRGIIYDRFGKILADNKATFFAFLKVKEFLRDEEVKVKTIKLIKEVLGLTEKDIKDLIERDGNNFSENVLLASELKPEQVIQLESASLPAIFLESGYERRYEKGKIFSPVLGYVGLANSGDIENNPQLRPNEFVGRAGVEAFYDSILRGQPKIVSIGRDSKGKLIDKQEKQPAKIGDSLELTIDGEFQEYFYKRLSEGLAYLGLEAGAGIAINPQNGEILALVNLPSFDNNIMSGFGRNKEKISILNSPSKPLFNRVISGLYSPGSTIKPLVGVAALKEKIIEPSRLIFSPGYLEIPNPYNPENPSRYLDWRYQGDINLYSAIAQSSNVYFYLVGGGHPPKISPPEILRGGGPIKGLGIEKLYLWWRKFGLGEKSGIDLPGESEGFLPSAEQKKKNSSKAWLLGDTYNVSIGQGDLLLTPLQIINYISAIANGGKIYRPFVKKNSKPSVLVNLSELLPEIKEVQKGMKLAVQSPKGTANLLSSLPFSVGAKTGSAQIEGNRAENAFFVGYAPFESPKIAILVLVERAREGSLNALPIAKDVLQWYYEHRLKGQD